MNQFPHPIPAEPVAAQRLSRMPSDAGDKGLVHQAPAGSKTPTPLPAASALPPFDPGAGRILEDESSWDSI